MTPQIQDLIRHYALAEDGNEKGAAKYRCDFKLIDPKKGSATGYLVKYVSKNIDGEGLYVGVYGEDPITAAQRVDAWSSYWCIRQFQQVGGPPVSVYRELRRLRKSLGIYSIIEKLVWLIIIAIGRDLLMQWVMYLLNAKSTR